VVPRRGTRVAADAVLKHAREVLGANRAPRFVWFVESLPRTDGGKLRRSELPAWVGYDRKVEVAPPSVSSAAAESSIEIALAALWAQVLRVRSVPKDADFFALGGDDVRGAHLLDQVRAAFGVDLPLQAMHEDAGTIAGMARRLER
jgi:hypothetical protein